MREIKTQKCDYENNQNYIELTLINGNKQWFFADAIVFYYTQETGAYPPVFTIVDSNTAAPGCGIRVSDIASSAVIETPEKIKSMITASKQQRDGVIQNAE